MPEPAIHIPDNLFRRKLLLSSASVGRSPLGALLETLCIDDIYTFKDDFDRGLDAAIWDSARLYHQPGDLQGSIASASLADEVDPDEEPVIRLATRTAGWRPVNRASVIFRFTLSPLAGKVEVGLASGDGGAARGIVQDKATPTAVVTADNFALVVQDTAHNAVLGIVRRDGTTIRNAAITPSIPWVATRPQTVLVSTQEQGDTLVWINGAFVGAFQNGPAPRSSMKLWFHVSSRADGLPNVSVDYVFAWQERSAVVTWPQAAGGQTT